MKRILNLALIFILLTILISVVGVSAASIDGENETVYSTGMIWDSWD